MQIDRPDSQVDAIPISREITPPPATAPQILSVGTALPAHCVDQENARDFAATLFSDVLGRDGTRLLQVFDHAGIASRRMCMPLEWYGVAHTMEERNALYIEHAVELSRDATESALDAAGLSPTEIDHVVFVSSTGIATPSIDARLSTALGFRQDCRRTPVWGLGCAGGAAGMSLVRDLASASPGSCVLLVALELCSLTFQHGDRDRRNLVATALFSDGAAAVIVSADAQPRSGSGTRSAAPRPRRIDAVEILGSSSTLWPETEDVMGWTVDAQGLHVVFSRDIPTIVRNWVREDLVRFLDGHGLTLQTLSHVIAHPGGPKVLAAYSEALELPPETFRHSEDVLRTCGNMSSPSCLFVLKKHLEETGIAPGETAVLSALGPGFSSEYVLLRGVKA